jgi:homogentisate 1,2-dioxygenase
LSEETRNVILIKGTIHQKDTAIINVCATNVSASNLIKQVLLNIKGQIDANTIVAGDFSTPFSTTNRSSTPKKIRIKYLTDMYRISLQINTEYYSSQQSITLSLK